MNDRSALVRPLIAMACLLVTLATATPVVAASRMWTELAPMPRARHGSVYDPKRDVVWVVGPKFDELLAVPMEASAVPRRFHPRAPSDWPSGRTGSVPSNAVYDAARDRILCVVNSDDQLVILALSLGESPRWSTVRNRSGSLSSGVSSTSVMLDTDNDRLVVYGGYTVSKLSGTRYNSETLIVYDFATERSWRPTTIGSPTPRFGHNAVFDAVHDRMIVFGGFTINEGEFRHPAVPLDEVWSLSLYDPVFTWSRVSLSRASPAPRYWAQAASDPSHSNAFMFGGSTDPEINEKTFLSDLWRLSIDSPTTAHWVPYANRPGAGRSSLAYDSRRGRLVLYGGLSTGPNGAWMSTGRVEVLDAAAPAGWSPLAAPSGVFAPRSNAEAFFDSTRQKAYVYFGDDYPTTFADVWELGFDPPAWTPFPHPAPAAPIMRSVFDPSTRRLIAFTATKDAANLFSLPIDGPRAWTRLLTTSAPPTATEDYSVGIDELRQQLFVVGGHRATDSSSINISVLDLATGLWSVPRQAGFLRPMFAPLVITDRARDRLLIARRGYRPDTLWAVTLNPFGTWSIITPSGTAAMLGLSALTYDAQHDRLFAVSREDSRETYDGYATAWTLSLAGEPTWTPLPASRKTVSRSGPALVYDDRRDRLVMIGGVTSNQHLNDIWALPLAEPLPLAVQVGPLDVEARRVVLRWHASETIDAAVERSTLESDWTTVGAPTQDTAGELSFVDTTVSGGDYFYRLAVDDGGTVTRMGLLLVHVPASPPPPNGAPTLRLTLEDTGPNPTRLRMTFAITLPSSQLAARLDLIDLIGRVVQTMDVSGTAGRRYVVVIPSRSMRSGVYFARLVQADHSAIRRIVLAE